MKQRITNFENFINEAAINIRVSKNEVKKLRKKYPQAFEFMIKNSVDVEPRGIFIDDGNGGIPDYKYFYSEFGIKKLQQKTDTKKFGDLEVTIYGMPPDFREDFGTMWRHCFAEIRSTNMSGIIISEWSAGGEAYKIADKGNYTDII